MTGGKIDVYLDVASLYSYVAFAYLQQHTAQLEAHGVEIEYHPVFLGGIMGATTNQPPWTLPAKGRYLQHDVRRSLLRVHLPGTIKTPPDFFKRANTILPLRSLTHLKSTLPTAHYLATWAQLFKSFWVDHADLTEPATLAAALAQTTAGFEPIFTLSSPSPSPSPGAETGTSTSPPPRTPGVSAPAQTPAAAATAAVGEADGIELKPPSSSASSSPPQLVPTSRVLAAANFPPVKAAVKAQTDAALEKGAFGCPWFWVTPSTTVPEGKAVGGKDSSTATTTTPSKGEKAGGEPFFGSDRFHFIFQVLGVPFEDVRILPPTVSGEGKGKL